MMLAIKDIIIYILCIIIIILYINKENTFINTFSNIDDLKKYANDDKSAITTILKFMNNIQNDTYLLKKQVSIDKLIIKNNLIVHNTENIITNNIKFNIDSTTITSNGIINNRILEIFPRYTIIAYHNINLNKLPKRWVLCDGKKWYVHKTDYTKEYVGFTTDDNGKNMESIFRNSYGRDLNNNLRVDYDYDTIDVPDLRGYFIIGSNELTVGDCPIEPTPGKYKFNCQGGTDKVILEEKHLPAHIHPTYLVMNEEEYKPSMLKRYDFGPGKDRLDIDLESSRSYLMDIDKYGNFGYGKYQDDGSLLYEGAYPHENMPPYLVSQYIMKI